MTSQLLMLDLVRTLYWFDEQLQVRLEALGWGRRGRSQSLILANIANGEFQGFVEGWTFSAGYNSLYLTLTVSPTAYSLQATRWNAVPINETWNTLNTDLQWINATIVA